VLSSPPCGDCDTEYCDGGGRRDRRRHAAHGEGPGGLPPAYDLLWRRPTVRAPFIAAIDDPSRICDSRDIGAYLGLFPRCHQSEEVDYVGGASKCGHPRVRTLLYEVGNVMLTRNTGQLKLKDWPFGIAKRSTMRKARIAPARRRAIIARTMLRDGTEFGLA
jgi:hypothetical protein